MLRDFVILWINSHHMPDSNWIRRLLWLTVLAGLFLLLISFSIPSEQKNAWIFGLSRERILLSAGMLIGILLLALAAFTAKAETGWLPLAASRMTQSASLLTASLWVWFFFLFFTLATLASFLQLGGDWGSIPALLERSRSLLAWLAFIFLSISFFILRAYKAEYARPSFWDKRVLGRFFVTASLGMTILAHWIILIFRLEFYTSLSGWFFYFRSDPGTNLDWVFGLFWLSLPGIIHLATTRLSGWKALLLVMAWGYLLQLGFLWLHWGSFNPAADWTILRYDVYARVVTTSTSSAPELLRNYETLYGDNIFTGTKSPGFLLLYMLTNQAANTLFPNLGGGTAPLSQLVMFVFPAIAMTAVIPLYWLGRELPGNQHAIAPVLLLMVFPGMLLTTLFMDHTLYPVLFLLLTWFSYRLAQKGSFIQALGLGALYYLALFLAFALLPAVFMGLALIGLHFLLFQRTWQALQRGLLLAAGLAAGFTSLYVFFSTVFGYDALTRYQNAIETHRLAKNYLGGWETLPGTILLNNLDFGLGAGFPTLFMLLLLAGGLAWRLFQRKPITHMDWLQIAFFATFIVLNLSGQTRSETARLWLFTLPLLALFITDWLNKIFPSRRWVFWWMAAQLLTTFLLFKVSRFY